MSISDNTTTTHHIMVAAVESSMPMVAQETRDPKSKVYLSPTPAILILLSVVVMVVVYIGGYMCYLKRQERARSAAAGQDPRWLRRRSERQRGVIRAYEMT